MIPAKKCSGQSLFIDNMRHCRTGRSVSGWSIPHFLLNIFTARFFRESRRFFWPSKRAVNAYEHGDQVATSLKAEMAQTIRLARKQQRRVLRLFLLIFPPPPSLRGAAREAVGKKQFPAPVRCQPRSSHDAC